MRSNAIDWVVLQDVCVRTGWGLGWFMGILIGVVGFMSGGGPELSVVRAVVALVAFALLGWFTAMVIEKISLSSDSPANQASSEPETASTVGTTIDRTIGDDLEWPAAEPAAPARETNAA